MNDHTPDTRSMALFCDFENVALGVRESRYKQFDISKVLERLLLKGSIVVKKAYCDWERYREFKAAMHQASFELIEIPHVRLSGKNSADIRMVVDALDLCYTKSHVDTFVIISGDSDFSPLVSKLRENARTVIGVGVKNSTSELLINNCDEFIFYDDLVRVSEARAPVAPAEPEAAPDRPVRRRRSTRQGDADAVGESAAEAPASARRSARASARAADRMPERTAERAADRATDRATERATEPVTERTAEPVTERTAERVTDRAAERIPSDLTAVPVAPEPLMPESGEASEAPDGAAEARRQQALDLVVGTLEALTAERGEDEKIWGSMVKQTLRRRKPGFSEGYYGFRSFNRLLEEARDRGLIELSLDDKSGGYTVRSLA